MHVFVISSTSFQTISTYNFCTMCCTFIDAIKKPFKWILNVFEGSMWLLHYKTWLTHLFKLCLLKACVKTSWAISQFGPWLDYSYHANYLTSVHLFFIFEIKMKKIHTNNKCANLFVQMARKVQITEADSKVNKKALHFYNH